jgi:hypothetical protein
VNYLAGTHLTFLVEGEKEVRMLKVWEIFLVPEGEYRVCLVFGNSWGKRLL